MVRSSGAHRRRRRGADDSPPRSRNAWYELRKSRTASIGAVMLVLLFGACIATPWLATHDPIKQNYRERLQPPSEKHLLGTDRLGRDIYSRLLYGGRRLVTIAVVAVALSTGGGRAVRRADRLLRRARRHHRHAHRRRAARFPGVAALSPVRDGRPGLETRGSDDRPRAGECACSCRHAREGAARARLGAGREAEGVRRGVPRHGRFLGQHRAEPDPAQHHLAADRDLHGAAGLRYPDRGGAVVPRARYAAADAGLGLRPQRRARLHGDRIR